jgi:hypothetical protein
MINDKYSQTERKIKLRWIHMMCMFTQFNSSYNQPILISYFYGKNYFHIMVTELDKFLNLLKIFTKCRNVKKTLCNNINDNLTYEQNCITICYNKEVHKRHALLYVALITNQ